MTQTIGQRAIRHLQEMYPTAHGALHQSGRTSLRNTVDMAAARQEKDAFRAGWITNAGHSDGNYLTSCMEGDYALYQQHGTDYFAEAWARALGHDDEEPTPSPADLLVAKIAKGPEWGESITRWMDKMMLEARDIAGQTPAPGAEENDNAAKEPKP